MRGLRESFVPLAAKRLRDGGSQEGLCSHLARGGPRFCFCPRAVPHSSPAGPLADVFCWTASLAAGWAAHGAFMGSFGLYKVSSWPSRLQTRSSPHQDLIMFLSKGMAKLFWLHREKLSPSSPIYASLAMLRLPFSKRRRTLPSLTIHFIYFT